MWERTAVFDTVCLFVRKSKTRVRMFAAAGLLLLMTSTARAQTVTATIPVGENPQAIAVNTMTNTIYVANCPKTPSAQPGVNGSITVIDGSTNSAKSVPAGICPVAVAVNEVTNKIYVANNGKFCLISNACNQPGSITVIDGATNSAIELALSQPSPLPHPFGLAVNTNTNKIYVTSDIHVLVIDGNADSITTISTLLIRPYDIAANSATNRIYVSNFSALGAAEQTVTVIDGATDGTTQINDPKASDPIAVAVNPVTNKIYVANVGNLGKNGTNVGSITVIDGETNSTTNITDVNAIEPHAVAVNQLTNTVYVANVIDVARTGNGGVTVIDGATNSVASISDPNAQTSCNAYSSTRIVAVDPTRNQVYVANCGSNNVTVIDGATKAVSTVTDPSALGPIAVAVNSQTNKIYVANAGSNNVTVIEGGMGSQFTLLVTQTGSGSGHVTSIPAGIDCTNSCTANFTAGTVVALTASPASGSTFSGWSGACSGTNCSIALTSDQNVTATFNAGPPPDFSLTPSSATLTVQRGSQMTDVITIAPSNGSFNNAVQLTCAVNGSMPLASCSLSPTSVTPAATSSTTTLKVNAPSQMVRLMPAAPKLVGNLYAAFLVLPSIALIGLGSPGYNSKLRNRQFWSLCAFIASIVFQAGCGGGSNNPPPPLNYTVTVTATSGAIQHTTQVSVTVP